MSEPSPAIELFIPLGRAFDRMVGALFRPFDLAKWCVVGFSCWLARLLSGSGFGFGGGGGGGRAESAEAAGWGGAAAGATGFEDWAPLLALPLVGCIVVVVLAVILVLLWLSSRGHFLFLDHVVHDRTAIREPWREHGRQGDSLFLWRLGFGVAAFFLVALALLPMLFALAPWAGDGAPVEVLPVVLSLPLVLVAVVALLYVHLFLIDFVVPIMYRERIGAVAAWRRFLPLFGRHPGHFLLYGLLVLGLHLGVGLGVAAVGFATCCLGFLILIIPYVGTVILLPVHYTFRAYSLEVLAQHGPGLDLWPAPPPSETGPTAPG